MKKYIVKLATGGSKCTTQIIMKPRKPTMIINEIEVTAMSEEDAITKVYDTFDTGFALECKEITE